MNSNASIIFIKKKNKKITSPKKKKTSLPHVKATHSYPEISIFLKKNSLKQSKICFYSNSKFYTVITNLHPSALTYIIFLLFKPQISFTSHNFYPNQ